MYLGGENGTEVPMYTSVGNADNGGNMVSVNWNTAEDEDGTLVAWPSVNEAKMEDIGRFSHFLKVLNYAEELASYFYIF